MTQAVSIWLTLDEAAEHTRLSKSTLQRWVTDGYLLAGIHYGGTDRLRRFDREMLDLAVRFQHDAQAHEQAITKKRRELLGKGR